MSVLSDVIRSGIRGEDLAGLPQETRDALEPLLRFVNTGIQGLAQALTRNVSLSDNMRTEIQTVPLTHGVPQLVSLKKLPQAKGVRSISVGSADSKTQHALAQPLHLIGTTVPNQVRVMGMFQDVTAVRVPVTMELTPEGSYTSLTPSDGKWTAFPYATNWVDFGAPNMGGGYMKDASGRVYLRGLNKYGLAAAGGGILMGTLPVGYRPSAAMLWALPNWTGAAWAIGAAQVLSSGVVNTIIFANGGAATSGLQLDGISFDTRT